MVLGRIAVLLLVVLASNACGSPQSKPAASATPRPASLRETDTRPRGKLPPEHIQRVVRASFGKLRKCYEAGLARNAKLEGRASIDFLIESDGKVITAQDAQSTLPDADVIACLVAHFRELVFDAPEGGVVHVVYPIEFYPGD